MALQCYGLRVRPSAQGLPYVRHLRLASCCVSVWQHQCILLPLCAYILVCNVESMQRATGLAAAQRSQTSHFMASGVRSPPQESPTGPWAMTASRMAG